jgi:hypothetical protein
MILSEAAALLGEQSKYFLDVYKLYNYRDEQLLKDYLDFVCTEPVEWMRGFPARLRNISSFAKPKTALIKLLKHETVQTTLGREYVQKVYDVVWKTYKQHAEIIVAKREAKHDAKPQADSMLGSARESSRESILDQMEERTGEPRIPHMSLCDLDNDAESVHSVRRPRSMIVAPVMLAPATGTNWERKYRIVEAAYRGLLEHYKSTHPGLAESALMLLDAISSSDV